MDSIVDGGHQTNLILDEVDLAYKKIQPLIQEGKKDMALSAMAQLAEKYPDFAIAHNDLGVLYYQKGEKEKAFWHYQRATELNPENTTFQKNLADFYYVELGRTEQALEIYLALLKDNPSDQEILFTLGQVCKDLQKYEDARFFYNRILDIEPWNLEAQEQLDSLPTQTSS